MIKEGLKLTYSMGNIEGVRESIKFEIGDIVWVYYISESYRKEHRDYKYNRDKCKIIAISPSSDGKHFESYGVEDIETGAKGYWYYPTFLEPISAMAGRFIQQKLN